LRSPKRSLPTGGGNELDVWRSNFAGLDGSPRLTDEQVEYQVHDRLSFSRFLGLAIEDSIPDATTLWLFREKLAKAGLIEKLFDRFNQHLAAKIRAKRFLGHAVIEMVRWIRSARPAASTITPLRTHMVSWLRQ
jgi:IS5 family transposase